MMEIIDKDIDISDEEIEVVKKQFYDVWKSFCALEATMAQHEEKKRTPLLNRASNFVLQDSLDNKSEDIDPRKMARLVNKCKEMILPLHPHDVFNHFLASCEFADFMKENVANDDAAEKIINTIMYQCSPYEIKYIEASGWFKCPLEYAISARKWGLADRLIEIGCDPTNYLIHYAADNDRVALEYLKSKGADFHNKKHSMFVWSVLERHFDLAEELLSQGANIMASRNHRKD